MMQGYSFLKVRGKTKSTFSGPTEMVPPPQPIGPPGGRGVYGCGVFRRRLATPRAELPCSRHIVHCFEHFQYVTQRVPFLCLKLQSCLRGSLADHLRRSRKPLGGSLTVAYAPGAPLASDIQRFGTRAGGGSMPYRGWRPRWCQPRVQRALKWQQQQPGGVHWTREGRNPKPPPLLLGALCWNSN